jgi:hypothetical protein
MRQRRIRIIYYIDHERNFKCKQLRVRKSYTKMKNKAWIKTIKIVYDRLSKFKKLLMNRSKKDKRTLNSNEMSFKISTI